MGLVFVQQVQLAASFVAMPTASASPHLVHLDQGGSVGSLQEDSGRPELVTHTHVLVVTRTPVSPHHVYRAVRAVLARFQVILMLVEADKARLSQKSMLAGRVGQNLSVHNVAYIFSLQKTPPHERGRESYHSPL